MLCSYKLSSLDPLSVSKRCRLVFGVALLWQPEVAYVYRGVIEQYAGCPEAMEAAAAAVQNLTACNWKVRESMQ